MFFIAGMLATVVSLALMFVTNDDRWFRYGYPASILLTVAPWLTKRVRRRMRRRRAEWWL